MVEVRIDMSISYSWLCRGCGEHLFADDLWDLGYEAHDKCYQAMHGRHLPGIALAAGYGDIYSFMAAETERLGHTDYVVIPNHDGWPG